MKMNEISNISSEKKKLSVTVKNIIRTLTFCCVILFFCPMFMVSCSDSDWGVDTDLIKVSAVTAIKGISSYGETLVSPQPVIALCLLLPVAVLVFLFIKKFTDKQTSAAVCGMTVLDLIIWIIFRTSAKKFAEDAQCQFKTTGWYVINIIALLLILIFTVLILINRLQMQTDLMDVFSKKDIHNAMGQMSDTVGHFSNTMSQMAGKVAGNIRKRTMKEDIIGYCAKCGKPITYGHKFCISCGTPVPESMIAEAEAARKAAEEARRAEEAKREAEAARKAEEAKRKEEARREEAKRIAEEQRKSAESVAKTEEIAEKQTKMQEKTDDTPESAEQYMETEDKVVKCPQCGAEIEANAKFCKFCGFKQW